MTQDSCAAIIHAALGVLVGCAKIIRGSGSATRARGDCNTRGVHHRSGGRSSWGCALCSTCMVLLTSSPHKNHGDDGAQSMQMLGNWGVLR